MLNSVQFELKDSLVEGEKHATAGDLDLILYGTYYYVLYRGATITSPWGKVISFFKYSLPPFWEKKVNGLVPKEELTLEDALPILKSYADTMRRTADCNILSAGLYGSRARGDARRDSDYDVLFLVDKNFNKNLDDISRDLFFDTANDISNEFDIDIAPCMYFVDDYKRHKERGDQFIINVELDLVKL